MAQLVLARDFLGQLGQLPKKSQTKVGQIVEQFRRLTAAELRAHKGIHLESYNNAKDSRARTIRIDSNHRGVVLDVGDDELFILTQIGTHDDVDRWMTNNTFRVNEATGALEIINTVLLDEVLAATQPAAPDDVALFTHRRDRDFINLGISADLVPVLRAFTNETELLGLVGILPQSQGDALLMLTEGETVDAIYAQVAGARSGDIDPDDVAAAVVSPASKAEFAIVSSEDELQEMLAKPLALWRTYLHPSQRDAAYRETYSGPARVTGGAGTGKTVVAIHRASFLAERVVDPVGRPVLFTTFTKNLATAIERDLQELAGADVVGRVDVVNVDALAYRVVRDAEDARPAIATGDEVKQIIRRIVDERGLDHSEEFVVNEWEQVILAQDCRSRGDYFEVTRTGRGIRLERRQRAVVWKVIEELTRELTEAGKRTYLQLAVAAQGYLAARTLKPYEHVVVDEAQDLHEAQWRLLRAAVPEQANDMFVVGDSHQRIYDRRSSLSRVGINIVGRSRKLRINYRTTHEILRFGLAVLGEGEFDDLDLGTDNHTQAGYHSFLHGPDPTTDGERSAQAQYGALVEQIKSWIDGGVPAETIAVCARVRDQLAGPEKALADVGIDTCLLGATEPTGQGVRLATMHRLKGLEFRCVAIVDCDDDSMPAHWDLSPAAVDPVQREQDLQRERCLLYVACTRARDGLWVGWSGKPSRFLP